MNPLQRRRARFAARSGTVVSAGMLVLSIATMPAGTATAAPINGGTLQVLSGPDAPSVGVPITSGGSATLFFLRAPAGAACTGDSASAGYRVQSYMVPASVNPADLTFDSGGPVPQGTGAALRQPLFATSSAYLNGNTAVANVAGGSGALVDNPAFDFGVFGADGPTVIPNGTYNLGIACTNGDASATQLDKYWNVQMTFTADAADSPSGIRWTVQPTTTATTTTAADASTTTTTISGVSTTTVAGATTTTIRSGTTTTVLGSASTTINVSSTLFGSGAGSASGGGRTIVATGSSPIPIALWAILLLVFGRMALLLGRPMRVLPPKSR